MLDTHEIRGILVDLVDMVAENNEKRDVAARAAERPALVAQLAATIYAGYFANPTDYDMTADDAVDNALAILDAVARKVGPV